MNWDNAIELAEHSAAECTATATDCTARAAECDDTAARSVAIERAYWSARAGVLRRQAADALAAADSWRRLASTARQATDLGHAA